MMTHDRLENTIARVLATEGRDGIIPLARLTSGILEELPPRARLRKMLIVAQADEQARPWSFGAERYMRRWYTITRNEQGPGFALATWEKGIDEPEKPRQEALTYADAEAVLAVLRAQAV